MTKIFAYSVNGHDGIRKYIHNIDGQIVVASSDGDGGCFAVLYGATYATFPPDPNVVLLSVEPDDLLTDTMSALLAKHPKHGVQKGDTLRQAIKKIRTAENGCPHFMVG